MSLRKRIYVLMLAPMVATAMYLYMRERPLDATATPHRHENVRQAEAPSPTRQSPMVRPAAVKRKSTPPADPLPTSVSGRVQTERGVALAGALICAVDPSARCCTSPTCTRSDAAGAFALALEGTRSPTLSVSHPGYLPTTRSTAALNDTESLVFTLKQGGAQITGSVMDATGGPIVGAEVHALGGEGTSVLSGVDGEFEVRLPLGANQLRVRAEGYSESAREVWAPSSDVQIALAPASELQGRVVVRSTGAPLGGIAVLLAHGNAGAQSGVVHSNSDGSFSVGGLLAGQYVISAVDARWRSDEHLVRLELGEKKGPLILEVASATSLEGSVSVAGAACREGSVGLSGPISMVSEVGRDGRVMFEGLLPGTYDAEVRCSPGAPLAERILVTQEARTRAWNLHPGLSVSGVVATIGGDPVAGEEVMIAPAAGTAELSSARCVTDATGEFECVGLLPGDHDCWLASSLPTDDTVVRVTLGNGNVDNVRLVANAMGKVHARLPATGQLDLASMVLVARRAGALPVRGRSNAEGFLFEHLVLGDYELAFEPSSEPAATVRLVEPGQVVTVNLNVPERTTISGRVLDEEGLPVIDAWVHARASGSDFVRSGASTSALTDQSGAFVLSNVVRGRHDIEVDATIGRARLVNVDAGGRPIVVSLRTHAYLTARVTTTEGRPVERFTLAYRRQGDAEEYLDEGHHGSWSSPHIAPGTYDIIVMSEHGSERESFEVPPGSDLEVAFQVQPGAVSSGAGVARLGAANDAAEH